MTPSENQALGLDEFRSGKTVLASTPNLITLETTSRCNLQCVMCSHAVGGVARPKHLDESISGSLSAFLSHASAIQLHGIGEPINSPAFWSSLANVPPPEICESSINTNFTVINASQMERLVNSNLRLINVSLDASTPGTYQKIRGFDFKKVIDNIKTFQERKKTLNKKYPLLYLNMTLMRSNIEELVDFIDLAFDLSANYVCAWHLNRWPDAEMSRLVVIRDDWTFDYKKEGLWNFPDLSNDCINKASLRAKELGISLWLPTSTNVYFENTVS
jgi:MoaA/NifB/PqqE/SkfB family radical SAM enzyme